MNRDEIIARHPIAEFLRSRGISLIRSGENFVTNACPIGPHSKRGHRPVMIYPKTQSWSYHDHKVGGSVIDWVMSEKGISVGEAMRELGGGANEKFVCAYDYTDEREKLLFQVCRLNPKNFKARRGPDDPKWERGIKGVRRVLYRLPEVIEAQLVCITEGEKNADDLTKLGFVATTNPFGAGRWRKEYNEFLRGKDIVVFGDVGDPDRAGEKHTQQVIASLRSSGIAARHAQQPDGFHDVSDWIATLRQTAPGEERETIAQLIEQTPLWQQPAKRREISFRSPSEILEMPRNPKANFFGDRLLGVTQSLVLAGIGGLGKSRLLLQLLVAFILERDWCGIETHHTKGKPWMLIQTQNSIDRLQDDLEPLKQYSGRDWSPVEKNLLIHTLETDRDLMLHLSEPQNIRDLESAIRDYNPIGVAFDPLNEVGIGDLSKDVDMMATCDVIGRVSRAGNPERAIIILTHAITGTAGMKKAFGFEAAGFGRNSKVLQMWSRAFINIIPGKEDYSVLLFSCGKNNNGKMFSPFAVRLNPDTKIYEPEPDFDIEGFHEQLTTTGKKQKPKFSVEMVKELVKFSGEKDMAGLAGLIQKKTGCRQSRAYELVHEGRKARIFRFHRDTELYALA